MLLVVRLVLLVPALFDWPRMKLPPGAGDQPDTTRASPTATTVANGVRSGSWSCHLSTPHAVRRDRRKAAPAAESSSYECGVVW